MLALTLLKLSVFCALFASCLARGLILSIEKKKILLPPFIFVSPFRQLKIGCFAHCLKCLQGLIKVNRGSIMV